MKQTPQPHTRTPGQPAWPHQAAPRTRRPARGRQRLLLTTAATSVALLMSAAAPAAEADEADPTDSEAVLEAAIEALVEAQEDFPVSPEREALEEALVATLQNATMVGRWHPVADGEVGEERRDEYRIAGANKISGNRWVVRARLRDDMPNLVIPVPLQVEWAGDTPVLIVDNFGLPGMNRYSARVLIYDDTYAGTWSGGGMAGLISGIIVREPSDETPAEDADIPPDAPESAPEPVAEIEVPAGAEGD